MQRTHTHTYISLSLFGTEVVFSKSLFSHHPNLPSAFRVDLSRQGWGNGGAVQEGKAPPQDLA